MLCLVRHTLRAIYGNQQVSADHPAAHRATKSQGLNPVQVPCEVWAGTGRFSEEQGDLPSHQRGDPRQDGGRGQGCLAEWGAQTHTAQQGQPSTGRAATSSLCLGSYSNTNTAASWMNEHIGRIC